MQISLENEASLHSLAPHHNILHWTPKNSKPLQRPSNVPLIAPPPLTTKLTRVQNHQIDPERLHSQSNTATNYSQTSSLLHSLGIMLLLRLIHHSLPHALILSLCRTKHASARIDRSNHMGSSSQSHSQTQTPLLRHPSITLTLTRDTLTHFLPPAHTPTGFSLSVIGSSQYFNGLLPSRQTNTKPSRVFASMLLIHKGHENDCGGRGGRSSLGPTLLGIIHGIRGVWRLMNGLSCVSEIWVRLALIVD